MAFEFGLYYKALSDENNWIRFYAISKIVKTLFKSNFKVKQALIDLILEHFDDKDERVRATAVIFFAKYKVASVIDRLMAISNDNDARVRANAVETLAVYMPERPPGLQDHLLKFHNDPNNRVRANAALALLPYCWDQSLATLTTMVTDDNNMMRVSAAWALRFFKDESVGKLLVRALKNEKEEMVIAQLTSSLAYFADQVNVFSLEEQIKIILPANGGEQQIRGKSCAP
ncbi:MAG: HEAT repeat domain-containing protein [Oligoflexia bacterium]|nr:HEAT repeat domain-containing protein [Oligoflexia bacterium]